MAALLITHFVVGENVRCGGWEGVSYHSGTDSTGITLRDTGCASSVFCQCIARRASYNIFFSLRMVHDDDLLAVRVAVLLHTSTAGIDHIEADKAKAYLARDRVLLESLGSIYRSASGNAGQCRYGAPHHDGAGGTSGVERYYLGR